MFIINVLPFALYSIHESLINHDAWKLILLIRQVCNYVSALKLSINQIAYFRTIIKDYIELRIKLFPNEKLRPKHHYITHYPYMIKTLGPARHYSTLMFERKHRYFKNIMRHSANCKNVLLMLSTKHQLLQASIELNYNLYSDIIIADDAQPFFVENYCDDVITRLSKICPLDECNLVAQKLLFRNNEYKTGMTICTETDEYNYFHLCKINFMFLHKNMKDFFNFGERIVVSYNSISGLYHEEASFTDKFICKNFNEVINIETVLCSKILVDSCVEFVYYFKSTPFQP